MIRNKALAVLFALGIGAQSSSAAAQAVLYGSDTLFVQTQQALVAAGIPDSTLHYAGTGSGNGGLAMNLGCPTCVPAIPARSQQIAPQSRFLQGPECGADSGVSGAVGQGLMVGLDAIGLFLSNNAGTTGCNTLRATGGTGVSFTDWRDVLRLLYAGQTVPTTANECSGTPAGRAPAAAGNVLGRCDSAARKALIANWNNLFSDGGCAKGSCGPALRHAFRRDDASGTTDVFLETLGLPKIPTGTAAYTATNRSFCNGNEAEDLDPVRTPCDDNEDVCQSIKYTERSNFDGNGGAPTTSNPQTDPAAQGGDLGVVLAVSLPTNLAVQYGPTCTFGKFAYTTQPFNANTRVQKCPDGNNWAFSQCLYPQAAGQFNCFANKNTRPGLRQWINMDGRAYNLKPLNPTTGAPLIVPASGTGDPRFVTPGAYRIHQAHKMANAAAAATVCTQVDATQQIGCLVSADPCSTAYAGRQALDWKKDNNPINKALKISLNGKPAVGADSVPNIQFVAEDPAGCPGNDFDERYALGRTLWMSASKGFGSFTTFTGLAAGPEKDYMTWIASHKAQWDTILQGNDFVPVPGAFRNRTCANSTTP